MYSKTQMTKDAKVSLFFTTNSSTGKLTFLNDVVMIYKTAIDKSGKGIVTGWDWKY
jgi:hypothetical protein